MTSARAEQLYADDFYAWTQLQAKELRRLARTPAERSPSICAHLAEEIADLGTERRDALRSWIRAHPRASAAARAFPGEGATARLDRRRS